MLALLFLAAALCSAQEAWEGNAAVVRRGTFPEEGLFAASNSFPRDSRIEVRNPVTGRSVEVTVVQRIEETENIFILLSEQAAERLGLSGSEVVRVTARLVTAPPSASWEPRPEQAFNPDPDINPAAELESRELAPLTSPGAEAAGVLEEPAPEATTEQPPRPREAEAGAEQELALEIPVEKPPVEGPAEVSDSGEAVAAGQTGEAQPVSPEETAPPEEQRLAELQQRLPQKQLFQPPRQSELFALSVPEEPAAQEEPAPEAALQPEVEPTEEPIVEEPRPEEPLQPPVVAELEPEEAAPILDTEPRPSLASPEASRDDLVVELPAPRPLEPERPEAEGTRLAAPAEEQPLTLEPATPPVVVPEEGPAEVAGAAGAEQPEEPAPAEEAVVEMATEPEVAEPEEPAEERVAAAAPIAKPAPAAAPLADALTRQAYFLQLGAYSSRSLAEKLARDIGPNYQVSILPTEDRNRTVYKVLIGPLNTDESGTLLYLFKARGFKDAFLRYVE